MITTKPKCQYWDKCYRQNPTHLAQFAHPRDQKEEENKQTPAHTAAKTTQEKKPPAKADAKKRARDDETEPAAAAAAAAPAPAASTAVAATASTSAGASTDASVYSKYDTHFDLEDVQLNPSTRQLWDEFHACCFSTSCPLHSPPTPAARFEELGSQLLTALYGGLEFGKDLFQMMQFAAQVMHKQQGHACCDIGTGSKKEGEAEEEGKQEETTTAKEGETTTSIEAASTTTTNASSASSSSSSSPACRWHACSTFLLTSLVPLLGLELAGPCRILLGQHRSEDPSKLHPFLLDRYFYDSPEVWTVLKEAAPTKPGAPLHYAYYRDDPRPEFPAAFIGRLEADSPVVQVVGPNLLAALLVAIDEAMEAQAGAKKGAAAKKKQKADSGAAVDTSTDITPHLTLVQLRSDLITFAESVGVQLTGKGGKRLPAKRDSAWLRRQKQVVCELDNKVGLVVPFESDIGWRPVNCSNSDLSSMVRQIELEKYSGLDVKFDSLDHLLMLTNLANDEHDPGMGIELALNLFAKTKTNAINSDICRLLSLGYSLVQRDFYSQVVEEHLRHRTRYASQPAN